MIGAAHTSTVRAIDAARADAFAAGALRRPDPTEHPMLPLLGLHGESVEPDPFDWSRAAAGLED